MDLRERTMIGKRIRLPAFLLYSRIKLIRRIAWRFFGQEGESFTPSKNAARVLVGGDVCFDLEIRTIPYVGAYRLDNAAHSRSILLNFCFKLWKLFCKTVLSPRYFSIFIYQPFQELLVKTPRNE